MTKVSFPIISIFKAKEKNMNFIVFKIMILISFFLQHCTEEGFFIMNPEIPKFSLVNASEISHLELIEASGIAVSRRKQGYIWAHNDSGDKARLFLLDSLGNHLGIFNLVGAKNRDWEDIAIGPGPENGKNYIYIGDIGDNNAKHDVKKIYRMPEPNLNKYRFPVEENIKSFDIISFTYPDGNRDAETLMVDPVTRDIYIVSKKEPMVNVYVARYPQSISETITLEFVSTIDVTIATGGDISSDGTEVLIKTYADIYYWSKQKNEPFSEVFKRTPKRLPYEMEPQGEGIAWKVQAKGYYTLSERFGKEIPKIYYYQRIIN
jgi:hypothetical protein